jgi:DNA replication and repair protein RecF
VPAKSDALKDTAPPQVHLTRLTLSDFRNYGQLSLDLEPGAVIFTGQNGAGKTNLLEAISLLTPGRGLRRAQLAEIARIGSSAGFAVHASLDGPEGDAEIGTGTAGGNGDPGDGGRKVRINGATARSADAMLEWLRVMWLTPMMDQLFTGPASDRRRFLDRLVLAVDPAHGQRAIAYEKAMRGRNRLLADEVHDDSWFDAIETQMAEAGTAIAAARAELVRLMTAMVERLPVDGAFPRAALALSGTLESEVNDKPAVDVEEGFRTALAQERARDRAAGRTLSGPHRTDLLVRHVPKDQAAELCSTGEQKALLVGMVLAHAQLVGDIAGMAPILLLDEIAAHFDADRRAALFDILQRLNCQYFATGTEPGLFESLQGRAQFLTVNAGQVSPTKGA